MKNQNENILLLQVLKKRKQRAAIRKGQSTWTDEVLLTPSIVDKQREVFFLQLRAACSKRRIDPAGG